MTHPDRYPDPLTPKPERRHTAKATALVALSGVAFFVVMMFLITLALLAFQR